MSELAQNDPYRGMESAKKDMRPGFLGGNGGGEKLAGSETRNSSAVDGLMNAETAAADAELAEQPDSLNATREGEENAGGFYSGSGRGTDDGGKNKGKAKGKGALKRGGPIVAIIGLILAVSLGMGGSQLLQPFSLVEQFRETFNSMQTSAKMRSNSFLRFQLSKNRVEVDSDDGVGKAFDGENFQITEGQRARLSAQGITYNEDYQGMRVLEYDDGSGAVKIITPDADSASKLGGDAVDFKTIYDTDSEFFDSFNTGSAEWRGAIANWFGSTTDEFLGNNDLTRNAFSDYQQKVRDAGGDTKAAALDTMAKRAEDIEDGGIKTSELEEKTGTSTDPETGKTTETWSLVDVNPDEDTIGDLAGKLDSYPDSYRATTDETSQKSTIKRSDIDNSYVNTKLNSIAGTVQKGANIGCTILNVLGSISLLVNASETLQIINLTTGYFEAIDKVKAGDGDDSPINDLANALNERKENTNVVIDAPEQEWSGIEGTLVTSSRNETTKKSAMESSGITALYSGGKVNPNDPSVQSFNLTSSFKNILGGLGVSVKMFKACTVAKLAANLVSAVTEATSIGACIVGVLVALPSGGASLTACLPALTELLGKIAISTAIGVIVSSVVATITPMAANMLTRDLIGDIGGEALGNALTFGSNTYLGSVHRTNGGSLADRSMFTKFAMAQQEVIADNAKYERMKRSPFDATSKYTFMGTLMKQLMNFTSVSSITNAVTTMSSSVSSSLIALMPTASAYDIEETLPTEEEYDEACPYLSSIGAVGDAFCNPYIITDTSTLNYDPLTDVIQKMPEGTFLGDSSDGNPKINAGSDLAKYILYCDNRASTFGVVDGNIASQVSSFATANTENSSLNAAANSAIGAIPVVGDAIDVVNSKEQLANMGYISGESCVAGNDIQANMDDEKGYMTDSPNWETAKLYQRFVEDQSLAESMGLFGENGKSSVTAFLEDYYEENPLDNSYEGILARYSGLTKNEVVALLDFIDYGNYIANYDAGSRYAFGEEIKPENDELIFENENKIADGYFLLVPDIVYADLRTRNFVV